MSVIYVDVGNERVITEEEPLGSQIDKGQQRLWLTT